jgi:outer membrane protein OmpA-like peptidoglycan-associated protein
MRMTEAFTHAPPALQRAMLMTGSTARSAIVEAAVGGDAGSRVGYWMDQQAEELSAAIPGASVDRIAEGIQVTFPSSLLFNFASDTIRAGAGPSLRKLAASLQKYPSTEMVLVGHMDALGDPGYNHDLSTRRAKSALAYLAGEGVAGGRMLASGRGKTEPLASNGTEAGRQANRRIEVAIFTHSHAGMLAL